MHTAAYEVLECNQQCKSRGEEREGTYKHGHFEDSEELFTESSDGGKTWSTMIPVPRKDMNDGCQRSGESILRVPDSGRIFIFYMVDCIIRSPVLSFVTRPPDSKLFSMEKVFREVYTYIIDDHSVTAEMTFVNSKPSIHVFWEEDKNGVRRLMEISTEDNGNTWSTPVSISVDSYCIGECLTTTSYSKLGGLMLGTFATRQDDYLRLFVTKDNAKSFNIMLASQKEERGISHSMHTVGMSICGDEANPNLYMLAQISRADYEYSVWDLKNMTFELNAQPFSEYGNGKGVKFGCRKQGAQAILTALVVVRIDNTDRLYIAQDTRPAL